MAQTQHDNMSTIVTHGGLAEHVDNGGVLGRPPGTLAIAIDDVDFTMVNWLVDAGATRRCR